VSFYLLDLIKEGDMKWMLVILISLIPLQAIAGLLKISIYEIDESDSLEVMVKTDGGEVLWVKCCG
jgi:hypothetical protein